MLIVACIFVCKVRWIEHILSRGALRVYHQAVWFYLIFERACSFFCITQEKRFSCFFCYLFFQQASTVVNHQAHDKAKESVTAYPPCLWLKELPVYQPYTCGREFIFVSTTI